MKKSFFTKKLLTKISAYALAFAPSLAFASETCVSGTKKDFTELFTYVTCVLSGYVIPFLVGIGVVIFLVGVVSYVRAGDNEEKRAAGRDLMWFGIIVLFVMISVWGFVGILTQSFFGKAPGFESLPPKAATVFQQS